MKRMICIMIVCISLFLIGCSPKWGGESGGFSFKILSSVSAPSMEMSETGLYYTEQTLSNTLRLMYRDNGEEEGTVVCWSPDCSHFSNDCAAVFRNNAVLLDADEGNNVYLLQSDNGSKSVSIIRMNAAERAKDEIQTYTLSKNNRSTCRITDAGIYQNKIYVLFIEQEKTDSYEYKLAEMSLDRKKVTIMRSWTYYMEDNSETILLEGIDPENIYFIKLEGAEDIKKYSLQAMNRTTRKIETVFECGAASMKLVGSEVIYKAYEAGQYVFRAYNLDTEKDQLLCETTKESIVLTGSAVVYQNRFTVGNESEELSYYWYDLETHEKVVPDLEGEFTTLADVKNGYAALRHYNGAQVWQLEIVKENEWKERK